MTSFYRGIPWSEDVEIETVLGDSRRAQELGQGQTAWHRLQTDDK